MKRSLSMQNDDIKTILNSKLDPATSMINDLHLKMKADENESNIKKAVFAASGRSLNDFVNDSKYFSKLYAEEIKKTTALSAEIRELEKQNIELNRTNSELKIVVENLKTENLKLNEEVKKLSIDQSKQRSNLTNKKSVHNKQTPKQTIEEIQKGNYNEINTDEDEDEMEP